MSLKSNTKKSLSSIQGDDQVFRKGVSTSLWSFDTPHQQHRLVARPNGRESFTSSVNFEKAARGFFIRTKTVYDMQNIIILRVSRSTTFADLRSRVIHKFALVDIKLPEDVQFMISDGSSYSSGAGGRLCCCGLSH
ncbi:hypothetical protein BDB01DRAFT_846769 [Pilobolus umbonatus]|nr:hypothetical protein BDB01DRAFT_846769 [Pilobolus umbonatus]